VGEIYYKYKSLNNFKHIVDILLYKRLYASKYRDLNDPMEGIYVHDFNLDFNFVNNIHNGKDKLRICSLSKDKNNILMWSHYANGHRGIILGVEIDQQKYEIEEITYSGIEVVKDININLNTPKQILSSKINSWSYEDETVL